MAPAVVSAWDAIVIGGGAAGFFAAVAAAEAAPGLRVLILESGREPLRKVRVSGGGRCNVGNACTDLAVLCGRYPRGGRELRGPFTRFGPSQLVAWLAAHGVQVKEEDHGRLFPVTDDSATIVDCLRDAASRAGVVLRCGAAVRSVRREQAGFALQLDHDEELNTPQLLLATGSSPAGLALAAGLGCTIVPPVPSLFTFAVTAPGLADLSGLSVPDAGLTWCHGGISHHSRGALLLTHRGLSGPAVLWCSAFAARALHDAGYRGELRLAWRAGGDAVSWQDHCAAQRRQAGGRSLAADPPEGLPRRLWQWLLGRSRIALDDRWSGLDRARQDALVRELSSCRLELAGKVPFVEEFVTCGGIALPQLDFRTMAIRAVPGLHAAGEVLDIDAVTGGYNFQACWTTGWLAGQAMAKGRGAATPGPIPPRHP